jgi:phosphate transporter
MGFGISYINLKISSGMTRSPLMRWVVLPATTVIVLTIVSQLKDRYLHGVVENAPPFTQASKDKVSTALHKLLHLYARCVTKEDVSVAQRQLKLHQREHIAWERDTVWRQMIGRERRGEADGHLETVGGTLAVQQEAEAVQISTPLGRLKLKRRHIWKLIAVSVFLALLCVQSVEGDEANRCFAILVFATILWATEVK